MLLEPRLLERLERLSLGSRDRIGGLYPGEHRSRRLGTSVDFADWRQYVPGDDFRRIDYQIYARLDRLLIRLYEAEDELLVRIFLDCSKSMEFDGKLRMGARLAGAVSYLAACRRDRARVWAVDGAGVRPSPWARSRDSAMLLLEWLDGLSASGEADVGAGLSRVLASGGPPGLTIVVSDLLSERWEDAVRRIGGSAGEGAVLHLLSPEEVNPDLTGDLMLVDSESRGSMEVSMSEQVMRSYRKRAEDWLAQVVGACRRRGIRYVRVDPDADLESLLMLDFRRQGIVR